MAGTRVLAMICGLAAHSFDLMLREDTHWQINSKLIYITSYRADGGYDSR